MKRLSDQLNIDSSIKSVPYDDMEEIIKYVFKNKKYKFFQNSELIDVNDRFRIFEHKGKNYIVKKSNRSDGILEVKHARKAEEKLDELKIDNYIIKIVKPNIYSIGNFSYILTEYMGNSIQECNYLKSNKLNIELNVIFNILKIFLEKGVLYRGFLPRNTVVKNNTIYLLDWEDAMFDINAVKGINLLWKTNFILNWSYFYKYNELEKQLKKYNVSNNQEPPLLKYEKKFKSIANLNYNIVDLRNFILKTVMESEKKINDGTNDFIIPPNDMAHLVSDLFNSDIDVLFDISNSVLRNKSEKKYIELLKMLSISIIDSYLNNIDIQKSAIKIILIFIEVSSRNKNELNYKYEILDLFENDKTKFLNKLKKILNKLLYDFNKKEISNENFIRIFNYIYSFR